MDREGLDGTRRTKNNGQADQKGIKQKTGAERTQGWVCKALEDSGR